MGMPAEPRVFCREVMHEYERQWSRAGGHALRHPLRLKIERIQRWCDETCTPDEFEARLAAAQASDDAGEALLADELLPLWRVVRAGGALPFSSV
jgi:hypothetical protein